MRDMENLLKRSDRADKIDMSSNIGSVVEFDKIRSDFDLITGEGDEIYEFYEAYESSSDVSANNVMDMIDDDEYFNFRDLVDDLNRSIDDTMEDKVSQLLMVADVLSRMKREGIIDQMYDEGIIDQEEKKAVSSHKVLDDISENLLSLGSVSLLQQRMNTDMTQVLGSLKDSLNTADVRYGRGSEQIVDTLVQMGIVEKSRSTALSTGRSTRDDRDDNVRFGNGRSSRDERERDRDRPGRLSTGSRSRDTREERYGSYNSSPRKKLRTLGRSSRDRRDGYDDRDRRYDEPRDRGSVRDDYRNDERYRRDDSFRREEDRRTSDRRGLDIRRDSGRRDERYEDDRRDRRDNRSGLSIGSRRDDRYEDDRYDDRDRRSSRRDSGSRYDRFARSSRRDSRDRRDRRGNLDDENVVYEFHPTR